MASLLFKGTAQANGTDPRIPTEPFLSNIQATKVFSSSSVQCMVGAEKHSSFPEDCSPEIVDMMNRGAEEDMQLP